MTDCISYLTVAQLRAEYGDDVTDLTDEALQRQIDQMAAYVEDQLGHTFGRALIATSTDADTVAVTATKLTIGGDDYLFSDYPTLQELMQAVNDAGEGYALELLPNVAPDTPCTLLKLLSATACGPAYANRVVLCLSAMYVLLSGNCSTHIFLPLDLASVTSVTESATALLATDYYATPGTSWLIRKRCTCLTLLCGHPKGQWSGAYPANIAVVFVPRYWGRVPSSLQALMLDAYSARGGLSPFQRESFGDYSYSRHTAPVATWQDLLGSGALRKYAVRFHP